MPLFRRSWMVVSALVITGLALAAAAKPAVSSEVRATLELNQQFYYAGDTFPVRLAITNNGTAEAANPVKGGLLPGFQVLSADGTALQPTGKAGGQEPARPSKLAPKAFYGAIVDLTETFPQLKSRGKFTIRWSADGLATDEIVVHIVPRFDPARDYVARVETEEGTFVIDLLKKTAPIAVKAFVDMANAGFYDGLLIHEVRADQLISGGDPTGTGGGQGAFRYPAELAAIPVVAGTVVLKPAGLAPPSNGSQFAISLRPEPRWTGQFTILGQVVEGLDVVKRISNLPSSDRPSFRPVKDVHTIHVLIQEKSTGTAAPSPANP
jgi:cyclophilin family peptidyl-prolyl cis-trans isomerase